MMLLKSTWEITPMFNRAFAFQTHGLFALHSQMLTTAADRRRTSPRPRILDLRF